MYLLFCQMEELQENICLRLWCVKPDNPDSCVTTGSLHAVYGTPCGGEKVSIFEPFSHIIQNLEKKINGSPTTMTCIHVKYIFVFHIFYSIAIMEIVSILMKWLKRKPMQVSNPTHEY